jgi:hypothetical protein
VKKQKDYLSFQMVNQLFVVILSVKMMIGSQKVIFVFGIKMLMYLILIQKGIPKEYFWILKLGVLLYFQMIYWFLEFSMVIIRSKFGKIFSCFNNRNMIYFLL